MTTFLLELQGSSNLNKQIIEATENLGIFLIGH